MLEDIVKLKNVNTDLTNRIVLDSTKNEQLLI